MYFDERSSLPSTADLIDQVKARYGLRSDGAVARLLGITTASISKHRQLKCSFDDATSLRIASLLQVEPQFVLAVARAQGAKRPDVRAVWERIARAAGTAATVLIALGFFAAPDTAKAAASAAAQLNQEYTLCDFWRRQKHL